MHELPWFQHSIGRLLMQAHLHGYPYKDTHSTTTELP